MTAFPLNFGPEQEGSGGLYKTASGECIPDGGPWDFKGYDENGKFRSIGGRLSGVHKVLCSAGAMAERGKQDIYLTDSGGFIVPRESPIGVEIRRAIQWCKAQHGEDDLVPLYLEDHVYNFYMARRVQETQEEEPRRTSARIAEDEAALSPGNGSGRALTRP